MTSCSHWDCLAARPSSLSMHLINRQLSMQDLKSFNDDEDETDEEAAAEK